MVKCAQRDINSDLALQSTDIPRQCRRGLESQTDIEAELGATSQKYFMPGEK